MLLFYAHGTLKAYYNYFYSRTPLITKGLGGSVCFGNTEFQGRLKCVVAALFTTHGSIIGCLN
jgi:hypothetical protein